MLVALHWLVAPAEAVYTYHKTITINGGQVTGGPLANFPLLFSTTDLDLRTTVNGGRVTSDPNGYDIIFKGLDDITCGGGPSPCTLDHEVEKYVATTGELIAWVRVPSINNGTVLNIYYGDSSVVAPTENPTGVWNANYKAVWHLKETPPALAIDSTINPNDGTPENSPTQATGKIDGSLSFVPNVLEQNVNVPNSASLQLATNMTVSAWARTASSDAQARIILAKWKFGQVPPAQNYWLGKLDASTFNFYVDSGQNVGISLGLVNDGLWHHIVGVADAGGTPALRLYVDGVQQATVGYSGTSQTGTSELRIGRNPDNILQDWDGGIDEVRVSDAARPAGWIATEYRNQSSPATFYSVCECTSTNYRSIGTNAGTLYATGTASVTAASSTVTLAGGACLPANVGQGDKLTLAGPAETLYILSRDSSTQLTVQGFAASTHTNQTYTITRAYNTLALWETGQQGNLVTDNRVEVGVAYNDGPFTAGAAIDGSTTDAAHSLRLTVAPFNRHDGTAGTGVVLDGQDLPGNSISVQDDFAIVEWFELKRHRGSNGGASLHVTSAAGVLVQHLLIHDFDDASFTVVGIKGNANSTFTVRNSILYDGGGAGGAAAIRGTNAPNTVTIQNCTIFGIAGRGVYEDAGVFTVTNTIAMNTTGPNFAIVSGTQSNNMSSDGTALPAANTNKVAANQFISIGAGLENFHLKFGADAIDKGTTLAGFSEDVDADGRPGLTTAWDIGADEKGTVVFRSIGTNAGTLYGTGNASVTAGATIVTFGGGASLPANVGQGDVLTFTGAPAETLYILSRDSSNQVTLQTAAASTHTNQTPYTITRAYNDFQPWETARQGDLVTTNRVEVGVAYNDGPFVYNPVGPASSTPALRIDGSTTNANCYMKLTVAQGQRHTGKEGTGAVMDGSGFTKFGIWALDDYAVIEWLELKGFHGTGLSGAASVLSGANNVLFNGLIIHGFFDGGNSAYGIRTDLNAPAGLVYTARNCIVYDGEDTGIRVANCDSRVIVENCTVYNMRGGTRQGAGAANGGSMTVTNTSSMGNADGDFAVFNGGTMTQSYNMSSDASATGTGSLPTRTASLQFVNINAGFEDLHLKAGAEAINTGTDLFPSSRFTNDIDNQVRPAGAAWDMGADELGATTAVELMSFEAVALDGAVDLVWRTGSELNNLGFHLYRSASADGPYERITASVIPGLGSSPLGASYSYRDMGLVNGVTYFYRLEDIETTGQTKLHGPVQATPQAGAVAAPPPSTGGSGGSSGSSGASGSSGSSPASRITYGNPSLNVLRVTRQGPYQVVLEMVTEGFYAVPQPDGSVRIEVPGFEEVSPPGSPLIPAKRAWVEAVAGKKVRVGAVRALEVASFSGLKPVPAGSPELVVGRDGTVRAGLRRRGEGAAFQQGGLYPEEAARVVEVAFQGEVKKALLELSPLRWEPATRQLLLARRLVVRVMFSGVEPSERSLGGARGRRQREVQRSASGAVVVQLLVRGRGLYGVSFEEVLGARRRGFAVTKLRLSRQGEAVAFHVEPEAATFGPGSVLYFASEGAVLNPYGQEAVYELELGSGGAVMPVGSASPAGSAASYYWRHGEWEENKAYQSGLVEAVDQWLWQGLVSPTTRSYPFTLSALGSSGEPSRLDVFLQGASDFEAAPDHHVRVLVNGVVAGEASWDGKLRQEIGAELPSGLLREGENQLQVENVGDTGAAYSYVFLDKFSLSYPRRLEAEGGVLVGSFSQSGAAEVSGLGAGALVMDTTDKAPKWLRGVAPTANGAAFSVVAGRTYLAVGAGSVLKPEVKKPLLSGLRSVENRADYLLIGPQEFLSVAEPLLERRRSQGLAAKAVSVEEVYQEFGHGESTPQAVKEFIAYAYHHWQRPSVRYVVLFGDGTYDFKSYLGTGRVNRVVPRLIKTSYMWTASDPSYAAVNGEDLLPDLAIGRLSAGTVEEGRVLVAKVLAFEDGGLNLSGSAVLVSDNADLAGNFELESDAIGTMLTDREVEKVYLRDLGASGVRPAVIDAFNRGAGLMSYVGHGGVAVWASENVFNNLDVNTLVPQSRQPFLMTMNCLNGYFHGPTLDSLGEVLVKADGKGAIAAFSPTGLSVDAAAHEYEKALIAELESGRHGRLGDAILAAQATYADTGAMPELLSIYHLLGDPALKLR